MKRVIRERIQPLLPPRVREATRQAMLQNDSLRAFIAQECIVPEAGEEKRAARIAWNAVWDGYLTWCRRTGQRPYSMDLHTAEGQTMISKLGVRVCSRKGALWLVGLRRRTAEDPEYRSAFRVADEDEDSLAWSSDEK